jgi:hypothetical protein
MMRKWEGTEYNDSSEITCVRHGGWGTVAQKWRTVGSIVTSWSCDYEIACPGWLNQPPACHSSAPTRVPLASAQGNVHLPVHPCV